MYLILAIIVVIALSECFLYARHFARSLTNNTSIYSDNNTDDAAIIILIPQKETKLYIN